MNVSAMDRCQDCGHVALMHTRPVERLRTYGCEQCRCLAFVTPGGIVILRPA